MAGRRVDELAAQARMIDGDLCLSTAALCQVLGVSKQLLGKWSSTGCPKARNGWWPLAHVLKWRGIVGAKVRSGRTVGDDELSLNQIKLRYDGEVKRLQADGLELKNAIARGEYIAQEEIVTELSRLFGELKAAIGGLSRRLAMEVGPFVDPTAARRIERDLADFLCSYLDRLAVGDIGEPSRKRIITAK